MANVFINPSVVAKEALRHLENQCVMGNLVYRGYEEEWKQRPRGWNIGDTVTIKAPAYFRVTDGRDISSNKAELKERSTTFVVDKWKNVGWTLTAEEMTFDLDKWSERFLKPAMAAIANYIDLTLLGLYTDIPNQVGTPGTTPQDFLTFALAQARLAEEACPQEGRSLVIDPQAQAYMANHLKGVFNQPMTKKAIERGQIGSNLSGFNVFTSQNVNTHTNGTWASGLTLQKDGASSGGDTTLAVKSGGTSETELHGDIFTIAAVNSVNPVSGQSTGNLRQFVVDTATNMDGSGEVAALACTPGTAPNALYDSTATATTFLPYQNIDILPAGDASILVAGTTGQQYKANLAFHRDCFGLVMVPIEIPASAPWKAQVSHNGYTIQVLRYMDGDTYTESIRFDVLFGVKTLNPFLGCRIAG